MVKITKPRKTSTAILLRLGTVLILLASLIGFMAASATGETWILLGDGMNADVYALALDNSGTLFAGGGFITAGGISANYIAQWNGTAWAPLGGGMNGEIYALVTDSNSNL